MKSIRRGRRGFSLIELLVVLVILALLVGLIGPRFLDQTKRGQRGAAETQIRNFKQAIEVYRLDHRNQLPQSLDDLIVEPSNSGGDWKGPYLDGVTSVPMDPWGNPYEFITPGPNGLDYEIRSLGSDGKEGGTGDAEDVSSVK